MMKKIPKKANKDELEITEPMQRPYFRVEFKPSGSPESPEDKVLELQAQWIRGYLS
jgi:hypothetical protein